MSPRFHPYIPKDILDRCGASQLTQICDEENTICRHNKVQKLSKWKCPIASLVYFPFVGESLECFSFDATSETILTPLLATKREHGLDRELQQIKLLEISYTTPLKATCINYRGSSHRWVGGAHISCLDLPH